jgi:hypothetical protein
MRRRQDQADERQCAAAVENKIAFDAPDSHVRLHQVGAIILMTLRHYARSGGVVRMPVQSLALSRVLVGLVQGFALYWLYEAASAKTWPATDGPLFASLQAVAIFVPLMVVGGLGNLRPRSLAIWAVGAVILCAGIAAYNILRLGPAGYAVSYGIFPYAPTMPVWLCLGIIMFIVDSLIVAGEADHKFIASYPRYFDISWKHGVQFVLAILFVGAFWLLLWLGSDLFNLIKLHFLAELIRKPWFSVPATTAAIAYAIHVTDIRANLVNGARVLKLTLLSWLLPLMTAFAIIFLLALPFAGLEPLWSTRRATSILLWSVAALIFLINAAYQDGDSETPAAAVLRQARWLAAIAIVPLTVLAGYCLLLRVQQYGWTPQRILACACVVVAACYAMGYGFAAITTGLALKPIAMTNVLTAYIIVAALLALFSPIADPARLSVADQVARLRSGQTPPEKFDYAFMRYGAGRYGVAALERLVKEAPEPLVTERAQQALQSTDRYQLQTAARTAAVTPDVRTANITVLRPAGQPSANSTLPESFLRFNWASSPRLSSLPRCLTANAKCEALLVDMDGDGQNEILLLNTPAGAVSVFKSDGGENWRMLGTLSRTSCPGVRDALVAGRFEAVTPSLREIEVNGQRLALMDNQCATATAR